MPAHDLCRAVFVNGTARRGARGLGSTTQNNLDWLQWSDAGWCQMRMRPHNIWHLPIYTGKGSVGRHPTFNILKMKIAFISF